MSNKNYNQHLMIGAAAVVVGILGTLSAMQRPHRAIKGWKEQAKDAAKQVWEGEMVNKNMMFGGIAGGLIGAATALLLAPKAGVDFIKDLAHPFSHQGEHKRSSFRKVASSSRKSSARKEEGARSARKHIAHHGKEYAEANKAYKSNAKKRSPVRRRTATAVLKQAAAAPEQTISEVTQ